MKTGIVITPNAYLYQEPEKTSITDEIFMGWAVGILEEAGEYIKVVTHYGYSGYMERIGVRECELEELKIRDRKGDSFYIIRLFVDVMSIPDVKGKILYTLSRGSLVTILPKVEEKGYQKVLLSNGSMGYLPKISLVKRKDTDGFLYTDDREEFFLNQEAISKIPQEILRKRITDNAKLYLGTQYRWGGKSAEGLDCSGMTFMSYWMCGIIIYRDAKIVKEYPIKEIPLEEINRGDLLFFPGHVAMYLENGKYIHTTANKFSFGCVINSLCETDADYRKDLREQLLCVGSIF